MSHLLEVKNFVTYVHLGCTANERAITQEVGFDITVKFYERPIACTSDRLEDSICYAELCQDAKEVATSQHFATVEALAHSVYEKLAQRVDGKASFQISVHKVRPPIENLRGGVRMTMGELH